LTTSSLPPVEADNRQSVQLIVTARRSLTLNDHPAALRAIDAAPEATGVDARPRPLPPLAIAAPIPLAAIPQSVNPANTLVGCGRPTQ
jgi:hypothetical protein